MARRRRRKRSRPLAVISVLAVLVLGAWWLYPSEGDALLRPPTPLIGETREPVGAPANSEAPPAPRESASSTVAPESASPIPTSEASPPAPTEEKLAAIVRSGEQAAARGDLIAARQTLSEAMRSGLSGSQADAVRNQLVHIADETIFSGRIFENDPLVERYVIKPGDHMAKIARTTMVSPELLARINSIADVNRIRAGRALKLVKGPFRAVVDKETYTMDVYLQDVLVRSYRVGLGADDSTPRGQWRVGTRLENPTYYHPRGGEIITADDPRNPLGERWIGLIGISGEALGQERYGIHGTIEPDSIGKSNSLGCIRMHNDDVEWVYDMLVEQRSTVEVK